jgi:hypothetical protein
MATHWSAMKRYQLRYWSLMTVYAVLLIGVIQLFSHAPPSGSLKYALAVAPALPILGVIAVFGRYLVEEADEFRRMMVVHSVLWGLAFVLAVTTVWGFLEVLAAAPHVALYWVFPIYCVGMGLSQPFLYWRYR